MSYTLECPYCDADLGSIDDTYEPTDYEHECDECGKVFMFEVEYEKTYYPRKADCLNGGDHDYRPMVGAPASYFAGRSRCNDCGYEKHEASESSPVGADKECK